MVMVRKSEVIKAIRELVNEGTLPTQISVRERVGRGSMREIAPVLSEWKENRREDIPARVKRLIGGYQSLSPVDQQIFRMNTDLKEITRKEKKRRMG